MLLDGIQLLRAKEEKPEKILESLNNGVRGPHMDGRTLAKRSLG